MYFYKDSNNWVVGNSTISFVPQASFTLQKNSETNVSILPIAQSNMGFQGHTSLEVTEIMKNAAGDFYADMDEFVIGVRGFFVNAAQEAADNLAARVEVLFIDYWIFGSLEFAPSSEFVSEGQNLAIYNDIGTLNVIAFYVFKNGLWEEIMGENTIPISNDKIYIDRIFNIQYKWNGLLLVELTNPYTTEDKAKVNLLAASIESTYAYGVLIDNNFSSPLVTRIGSLERHKTLPIQANMKGCLLLDNGTVNYYLNPTNWAQKANLTASVLDGTDGQVMVEIPEYYVKYETVNAMQFKVMISTMEMPGYTLVSKKYVSAYKASLQRSNSKLSSVINLTADFRGGNNNATYDGTSKTFLGKPATALSLDSFRTYARNRAAGTRWNCMTYEIRKSLYWLFVIEYANLNSQSAVTAKDAVTGYMQGGLGNGVTTVVNSEWNTFNAYYPLIPCGASNSLGNASGEVNYVCTDLGGAGVNRTVTANRYRGVENPFGDLSEWTDGILIDVKTDASGGTSKLYTSNDNPATFTSSVLGNYFYRGYISRTDGTTKQILFGTYGDILAVNNVGAGSTTYYCDYFWKDITANAIKGVLFGGYANDGSTAGLVFAIAAYAPSYTNASVGSRLCFV